MLCVLVIFIDENDGGVGDGGRLKRGNGKGLCSCDLIASHL